MVGFSVEAIREGLGRSLKPCWTWCWQAKIRGCVGIVGCNNPKIKHDYGHMTLAKELIKTRHPGAWRLVAPAIACAKAGLMQPEAIEDWRERA